MSSESITEGSGENSRIEELLNALMTGGLAEADRAELLERLRNDPSVRETYGSMVELEAMLHHEFPRLPEFREPAPLVRRPRRIAGRAFLPEKRGGKSLAAWAGGIAAAGLAFACWWLLKPDPRPVLVEAYGEWSWVDGAGRKRPLKVGAKLETTGSLVTEGTGAIAKLRFPDASTVVLSGEGELRVPGEKSKRLLLEGGNLEVEMSPQPKGRPARIETATARVEVVGTRFSVDATSLSTTVAVSEGKVKFKRLADGETVEIPRDRMATASLDARAGLEAKPFSKAPADWRAVPPAGGIFEAMPFKAGSSGDRQFIHHGVTFRNESADVFRGLAELSPDSTVRLKFRIADPSAYLRVFVSCHDARAKFHGNRQEQLKVSALPADEDGWRTYERKIRDMEMLTPAAGGGISGKRLTNLTISVLKATDQLEISEVEIGR